MFSGKDNTNNSKNLFSYHAGLFLRKALTKRLSLHSEANFTVNGAKLHFSAYHLEDSSIRTFYANQKIGYVEIPLLVRYSFNKFHFGAGPGISFKLFAKTEIANAGDRKEYIQDVDLAANMMTGVQLTKKWGVDLRYSYGLRNVNVEGHDVDRKGRALMLSVLYSIK